MISHSAPLPLWCEQVAEVRRAYGADTLDTGSVVVLLLDDERRPTGRTLIRAADPTLGPRERTLLLGEAMHVLRHGHVSGEAASQCLLLAFTGPSRRGVQRREWWSALREACAAVDLLPLDVVTVDQHGFSMSTTGDRAVAQRIVSSRTIDISAFPAHHHSHATL